MAEDDVRGRPVSELSDEELEQQGTQAHATRNWVFLHGSAEQFARHTTRMLELEREYVRRFPKRTWQGSGGAPGDPEKTAAAWRETLQGVIRQLEALIALPDAKPDPIGADDDPAGAFLLRIQDAGGRMHKLEAHQAARETGLERSALAALYKADPPLLVTDGEYRVITEAGRARTGSSG
jgi:hypothetical protein